MTIYNWKKSGKRHIFATQAKRNILNVIYLTALSLFVCGFHVYSQTEECTIGVASGRATSDGRPLVWKSRDVTNQHNVVKSDNTQKYNCTYVTDHNYPHSVRMGVNSKGFAIVSSTSTDLETNSGKITSGMFMFQALGNCSTVEEFEVLLNETNTSGRSTQSNYAVIDATGVACIYETGGNSYAKFNAEESESGYIVRTNFAISGGGSSGRNRYNRSSQLLKDFHKGDSLNYKSIIRYQMRDFSNSRSHPIKIPFENNWSADTPYGYINTGSCICRTYTAATVTIHGILPNENPQLTTMWTLLGHPTTTAAIPYWPIGSVPMVAAGTPKSLLCSEANIIRSSLYDIDNMNYLDSFKLDDGKGKGTFPYLFHIEDSIFDATDKFLAKLRQLKEPPNQLLNEMQNHLALDLLYKLKVYNSNFNQVDEYSNFKENFKIYTDILKDRLFIENYFHKDFKIKIYNTQGQLIINSSIHFGLNNINMNSLNKGIYIYEIFDGENRVVGKVVR